METIRISMRGFAEVSSAAPSRKQSTMRRFRSPKSGESVGRSNYYVKALSLIKRHHKGETAYVASQMSRLLAEAAVETVPRAKTKLLSNYQATADYLKHFGYRKLQIQSGKALYFIFQNLVISARPDLVAEEDGELVLIKLNLSRKEFSGGVSSTLLHVLFEAAQAKGLPIRSSRVECLHTVSGSRITGPKRGFPDKRQLNGMCRELLALCGQV